MKDNKLKELLAKTADGQISTAEAFAVLKELPFKDVGFAKLDSHRNIRNGSSEIIFGKNKTYAQLEVIVETMFSRKEDVLITHIDQQKADRLCEKYSTASYNQEANTFGLTHSEVSLKGLVSIVTAGTSDLPVAFEAQETLHFLGAETKLFPDVGVAGIHRLLSCVDEIEKANVVIVIAGMDGALPSVVGGLISKPIIAVPTSCGYGAAFEGVSPLLTMLNSCAAGVTVVNIDNGFGAGFSAALINRGCL